MHEAHDATSAEHALATVARDVAQILGPGGITREWAPVGLTIEVRPLATSGLCVRGTRRIVIRRGDPSVRQRYTVAHELAHLLLACADGGYGLNLSWQREESMCERFASRVLIPRNDLTRYVSNNAAEASVAWLRETARHFRASWSATVIALGEAGISGDAAFVLARHAGHPKRPHQMGLRIAHAATPPWLWLPCHQRIQSLGWRSVAAWEGGQSPGAVRNGRDRGLALKPGSAAPARTAMYRGDVASQSLVLQGGYRLVMAFDTATLEPQARLAPRRARSRASGDQLALSLA
jgi:hypothetical protein